MGLEPKFTRLGRLFAGEDDNGRLKVALCLSDLDEAGNAKGPSLTVQRHALFEAMRKKGLVPLSDLLNTKIEQAGPIDVDEVYRLAQAIGTESQRHGESPVSPERVWVPPSDVTKPLPIQPKTLLITASEFARFFHKTRQVIHVWAKTGFLNERGFTVERDITNHLIIGIPSTHEQYGKFLKWAAKRQKRHERQICN